MKKINGMYVLVGIFTIALIFWAFKLENDQFDRCLETHSRNECIRVFG